MTSSTWEHVSVMKQEVVQYLCTEETKTYIDGTFGLGGHVLEVLEHRPNIEKVYGSDLAEDHINEGATRILSVFPGVNIDVQHCNFSALPNYIATQNHPGPTSILLDLGLCSVHVDETEKGFTFQKEAPLKLTFGMNADFSAEIFLQKTDIDSLIKVIRDYGEEPFAHRIAKNIIEYRDEKAITTTSQLREIILSCVHFKDQKKALARVFQALRIHVNDELVHLSASLDGFWNIMKPADRLGIMSYHSLEDRIVKQWMKTKSTPTTHATPQNLHAILAPAEGKLITKKPLKASHNEVSKNPRARSAVFRIIQKK